MIVDRRWMGAGEKMLALVHSYSCSYSELTIFQLVVRQSKSHKKGS